MTDALVNELIKLEEGIVVFDALLQQEIVVLAPVMCILADNARASEIVSHLGAKSVENAW